MFVLWVLVLPASASVDPQSQAPLVMLLVVRSAIYDRTVLACVRLSPIDVTDGKRN